jgi:hypothetical protein
MKYKYSYDFQFSKLSKEDLTTFNIVLLDKDQLKKVSPGDLYDCDILLQSLLHAGYNAAYKNVWTSNTGFFALFYIDGNQMGAVQGSADVHMVMEWNLK